MIETAAWWWAGGAILVFSTVFWLVSLAKDDVSIVDSLWSLMFLLSAGVYAATASGTGPRTTLVLILVGVWAIRLSGYITWRNHGEPEDYRYRQIRRNNEPGFRFKSFYIVFGLQGLLAWMISLPLLVAISGQTALGWLDMIGVALWLVGFLFEAIGDFQLARFKADAHNQGKVMDAGLWRFTRHPNYFGNFTMWWGFYLIALSAGGVWTVISPLRMSFLLLKVSGVAMLEKDIGGLRPAYAEYMRSTNAFFPGPRRA